MFSEKIKAEVQMMVGGIPKPIRLILEKQRVKVQPYQPVAVLYYVQEMLKNGSSVFHCVLNERKFRGKLLHYLH